VDDQQHDERPETAQSWDGVRRFREPLAWTLLLIAAFIVLVSACQLLNLADAKIPIPSPAPVASSTSVPLGSGTSVRVGSSPAPGPVGPGPAPGPVGPGPVTVSAFALRASAVAPQFIQLAVQALPVLAVILVAFCGGVTERARPVVQTAAVVLAAAFVFGLISLEGAAASHTRPGTWFFLEGAGLAITATALGFTGAVMSSRPFRLALPRFQEPGDDDDFEDDTDFGGHD
jgi:hypothetical protein